MMLSDKSMKTKSKHLASLGGQDTKKRKHSIQSGDIFISGNMAFSQLTPFEMLMKSVIMVVGKDSK